MGISTRRLRLFVTSLTLAALALGVMGVVLFQVGVQEVAAAPAAVHTDRPVGGETQGQGTASMGLSGQGRRRVDALIGRQAVADDDSGSVALPQAGPELEVVKTDGVASVEPGDLLTYTITLVNTGDGDATGVVVTDTLPVSTTYQPGVTGWQQVGSTRAYTFSLATLTQGTTRTLTLTVALADPVPAGLEAITNTVEAADGNGAYDQGTDTDAVDAEPFLRIRKTDAFTEVVPGQSITYAITVSNQGDQDASGVVVTDTLPESTAYQPGPTGWQQVGSTRDYTVTVGPLGAGYTETLTLTVALTDTVPADLASIFNVVEVTDDDGGYASAFHLDTVSAAPDLVVSKSDGDDSVVPGDTITYTVTITNTGDREATGVVVTDTLPALTTWEGGTTGWQRPADSTQQVTYTVGSLAGAGLDVRALTLTVALTDLMPAGVEAITNTVEVADDGEAYGADTDEDAVDAAPDLVISKTDAFTTVVPGQTITYTITMTNTGDQDATGVVVRDTLHELLGFEGGTPGWQAVSATNAYTYTVGDLGAGYSETLKLTVSLTDTVPAGLEEITNTVEVSDDGLNGPLATDEATDTNDVDAAPDLVISKTDNVTMVDPGQMVTYTLTIVNVGTQGATGVVVTDTLPAAAYTTFVRASGGVSPVNGIVKWPIFNLDAGDSVTKTVTIAVKDLDPWPAGVEVITNRAGVADDGSNGADPTPDDNSADDVDVVDASPDLFIAKSDGKTSAEPGEVLLYKLSYVMNGTQNATGVVITETIPSYVTFSESGSTMGWQPTGVTGVYTYSLGDLSVGSGGRVDFAVTVSDTLPAGVEVISNRAQIADDGTSGPDETPGDNSDVDETSVDAAPDLGIYKDDGRESVEPSELVTYTLTIENVGTQGATNILVEDTLPEHTTFVAASDGGEETSPGSGVVTWPTFGLAAEGVVIRTVSVEVPLPVPAGMEAITNTASVADDGENGDDPELENNTASDIDAVDAAPAVALVKSDGRTQVRLGDILTYTLTIENVGDQDATDLVISDTLPSHTTWITASHDGVNLDGVVVWEDLELDVGVELQRTVTVQVDQLVPPGVSTITNQAEVAGPEGVYNTAQDVDTLVPVPNLTLTKDDGEDIVVAEQVVTYTLTLTNSGIAEATGIVLSDALPAPTTFITASHEGTLSGAVVTWPTFSLTSGGSVSRTVTVQVLDAIPAGVETITNTASAVDDGTHGPDADPSDNSAEDVDLVDADPVLSVAKSDGRDSVAAGEFLIYTLTITNTGTQDATGVVVTDTLPAHTEFVAASAGYIKVGDQVTWPASGLGVDDLIVRTVTVQVDDPLPSGAKTITNTVLATADGVPSASANDVDTIVSAPDLTVVKTDGRVGALPGEILTYTLTVENVGSQAATGVVLSDTLPANTSFSGASDGGSEDDGVVTWPEFALDGGAMVTRTVTVEVVDPWPAAAVPLLTNTVSVADDGLNGEDPVPGNNTGIDITFVWVRHAYLPFVARQ